MAATPPDIDVAVVPLVAIAEPDGGSAPVSDLRGGATGAPPPPLAGDAPPFPKRACAI